MTRLLMGVLTFQACVVAIFLLRCASRRWRTTAERALRSQSTDVVVMGYAPKEIEKMLITLQLCVAYETPRTGPDMSFGGSIHNLPGPGFATDEN